jgi:hypothetical protein
MKAHHGALLSRCSVGAAAAAGFGRSPPKVRLGCDEPGVADRRDVADVGATAAAENMKLR